MNRKGWTKVINSEAETCHWVDEKGEKHPATAEENEEVRRQLLHMRISGEKLRQDGERR